LGPDERKWPHRIRSATDVVAFEDSEGERPRLVIRPLAASQTVSGNPDGQNDEVLEVDLVIAATGYQRNSHLKMMKDVESLLPEADPTNGAPASNVNGQKSKTYTSTIGNRPVRVARDYSVQFAPGKVAPGSGIWLQGCNEGTHGVSPLFNPVQNSLIY
jgi:L-ornithine N5-monooxygenase